MAKSAENQEKQVKKTKKQVKTTEKQVKSLTVAEIKKQSKKLDEQIEHQIEANTGEVFKIKIDKRFRRTKQHDLIEDLIAFFNEGNRNIELLELASPYVSLLLIKYFTSVDVPDDIDEALYIMDELIDMEIFDKIINLMPEDEVVKFYELLHSIVSRMKDNIDEADKEAKELIDIVQNKETKDLLTNGEDN